jgi:tetratricopeptide (TPR) repeat protein
MFPSTNEALTPQWSGRLFWLIALLVIATPVPAQHEHHAAANEKPATLLPGVGNLRHLVTTKNAEAQQFFNQGLALIYAFNHEEARRSFARAAQLDPQLAMAHWGIALAVGPNYNEPQVDQSRLEAAVAALDKARALAATSGERERDYIEALSKRFQLNTDLKKCAIEYKDAMAVLHKKYPADNDAAVLYADSMMNLTPWQLWTKDGKPGEYTREVVAVLEAVLARAPQHMGANHLYIHAVEASRTPGRALPSARRLGTLAPQAGHLVHMPAHIYLRTGDYLAAARSNTAAAAVDRAYIKTTGASGMYPAMYYSHNLHFLAEAWNRAGNYRQAARAATQLADNAQQHLKAMPMVEGFLPFPAFVRLRFGKWNEALALPEPPREQAIAHAVWHYVRGVALASTGKINEAEQARAEFLKEAAGLPGETPFGLNPASSVLKIAEHALEARIAAAKGERPAAIEAWRKAVAAQDALNYDEPPGWYYPVRESLGAALLQAGQAKEAEEVFRADLVENPGNGRSLFGLAASLRAQGRASEAQKAQRDFLRAWRYADTKLRLADF